MWKAAWCFHSEGDPQAERWVAAKALEILSGNAGLVAATRRQLTPEQRRNADTAADYLHNKKRHLDYPTALAAGWPIATGVIEGACRHFVKDRMDLTGARWGLDGAEAILKLRALATTATSTPIGPTTSNRNGYASTTHATGTRSFPCRQSL